MIIAIVLTILVKLHYFDCETYIVTLVAAANIEIPLKNREDYNMDIWKIKEVWFAIKPPILMMLARGYVLIFSYH